MGNSNIRELTLRLIRKRYFQSFWQKLFHYSKVGMNYWGGATIGYSGEEYALRYANSKFMPSEMIIVFDVGANIGQFAELAVTEVRDNKIIYSFEPSNKTFSALNHFIKENGLSNVVTAHNIGFSATEENLTLYSSETASTIASLYNLENPLREFKDEHKEVVEIDTIDHFCALNSIQHIDYLKLDIEGHEYQVLLGAIDMLSQRKITFIQFEFGECDIDSKTFFRDFYKLLNKEYMLYRIVSDGLAPIPGYSTDLEVFSTANYLAELR